MTTKLIRAPEIIKRGICSNRQMIYRRMERDGFPRPLQLGPNTVAWSEDEVNAWLASRPRAEFKSSQAA